MYLILATVTESVQLSAYFKIEDLIQKSDPNKLLVKGSDNPADYFSRKPVSECSGEEETLAF